MRLQKCFISRNYSKTYYFIWETYCKIFLFTRILFSLQKLFENR